MIAVFGIGQWELILLVILALIVLVVASVIGLVIAAATRR
jgi:hypothetical protein